MLFGVSTFTIPLHFVELTERRNLFVHCDGNVSSQYFKVCSEHKFKIDPTLRVGDKLTVNPKYFKNAYECIYEIGVKLAHVIWRKLSSDHLEGSDRNIIEVTYGLIEKGEYKLAIKLLDFFTDTKIIKHSSEIDKRIMIINRAQAYKWSNDNDTCYKILSKFDWSASDDKFKLIFNSYEGGMQ